VLVAGIFAIAQGRRSAAEQHVALGMLLVGVALLLAGLASIVTKRMSFRFYASARTSYAGATALITGMMQVIVGGLAVATAHALATHVWQAKLDALLTNPWPLLIPLGLLLIGAGLLLVRRSSRYVGALGTVLFILPKTLPGVAALGAGAAILVRWAWTIYHPEAFLSFGRRVIRNRCCAARRTWPIGIPDQKHTLCRARHDRRTERHRSALARRKAFRFARQAGDRGQPSGRVEHHRRGHGCEGRARRLHPAAGGGQHGDQSDPVEGPAVRYHQGLRASLAHAPHAVRFRGELAVAREIAAGTHPVHQGQCWQDHLRHHRRRQPAAIGDAAVCADGRRARENDGSPVQGQFRRASRPDLEPHLVHDRSTRRRGAAHQGGEPARAGGHHASA